MLTYRNTNLLVGRPDWEINLQKTGFTNDAGECLVMQARIANQPVVIVLLDSWGRLTRIGAAEPPSGAALVHAPGHGVMARMKRSSSVAAPAKRPGQVGHASHPSTVVHSFRQAPIAASSTTAAASTCIAAAATLA